jgi:hypothetical protein
VLTAGGEVYHAWRSAFGPGGESGWIPWRDLPALGISFFTSSAGFVLAGMSAGALIGRLGTRIAFAAGGVAYALTGLYLASRPPFAAGTGNGADPAKDTGMA